MYEQRFNPYAANVAIVKDYFKRGKVLALGILYLVSMVIGIISALSTNMTSSYSDYMDLMEQLGIDAAYFPYFESGGAMETSATASVISSILVSSAISVLIAVAFILIFAKSRSTKPDSNPIAGVIILHVLSIIAFVAAIMIAVVLGILYLVILGSALLTAELSQQSVIMLVIAGILTIIAAFIIIFFAASMKNYYRSIRYSLNTVRLQSKGAVAYGVICIIMAVFTGFSLIDTVISAVTGSYIADSLLPIASTIITFVIQILNASIALGYNSHIKKHTLGYGNIPYNGGYAPMPQNQPVYQQPAYQDYQNPVPYQTPQNDPLQQNPYSDNFSGEEAPAQEPKPAYCPNCGAPADGSSVFCSNCGHKL